MKLLRDSMLAVVILSFWGDLANGQVFGGRAFGEGDSRSTLAINPDGSCVLTNETVQQRKSLEMQITSWERYSKFTEGLGAEDEIAALVASQAKKPELKILTNEELVSKLREMYQQQSGMGGNEMGEVDQVEATTNSVRLVTRRSFASLKELLGQHVYSWGPSIMMFEEARFEIDTNRNVRLTLTPSQNSTRYKKEVSRGWKAAKMKFEWKLILPGKILSSGLLATEGNATWLSMDGEKQDTVEAGLKLVGLPLVITAEAGGIKLDDSLESKKLVRAAWTQSSGEPDLPITDAGPGFLAEPMSLSISTTHVFPEGKKHFENEVEAAMLGTESSGTLVWAKLFPPKGRQIKSVSGLRVKA
ncbi:MAG: hypothetical protein NT154_20875, partial [Verrucomicrobia bacterium]|nr:hypothetical protein [Verrucomicrobiota bacterium]